MNWDQIAGKWSQVKGSVRQKWGKLTDDDLEIMAGSKDKLAGRIQERYGIAKEDAERQLDEWATTVQLRFEYGWKKHCSVRTLPHLFLAREWGAGSKGCRVP
jgi:uncharacterized protein YjbJ (UPF0337 family)